MSEINGINPNQINGIESGSIENAEPVKDVKPSTEVPDSIQLSSEAQNLQRIEQKIAGMPEVDMDRVNAIKSQIEQGRYQVNASQVADKMISLEQGLQLAKK